MQGRRARALYLFPTKALAQDQSAVLRRFSTAAKAERAAGSGARQATARMARQTERRTRDQGAHLRWRHPGDGAQADPHRRARRHHQPRHAPLRDPAAPHQVGAPLRDAALRRHRRTARLSRRLRLPRRQRHPPPAPHLPLLRLRPDLHPLLGHDRQSGRTGRADHRRARWRDDDRAQRRAARAAKSSSSTTRRSSTPNSASAAVRILEASRPRERADPQPASTRSSSPVPARPPRSC